VSPVHTFHVDGHKLVAVALNASDAAGHPVVLLHGIAGTVRFWTHDQISAFLAQGPCYALSLPGHYPAAFPPGFQKEQLTAEMIGRVLAGAILELVADQPVTLVGMSTGGFAALAIALYRPELVRRIISISGFCQGRWTGVLGGYQWLVRRGAAGRAVFKALSAIFQISPGMFRHACRFFASDVKAMVAYPHFRACTDAAYPYGKRLDLSSMADYFEVMPDIDIGDLLPGINVPALLLAGDRDRLVPPDQARLMSQLIPGSSLAMIEGGGHMLFAERPAEYQQAIYDWLGKTTW
jgi:pimeloyl-ACP methyl ester carboxylesterase